jgi:hypothetical protein
MKKIVASLIGITLIAIACASGSDPVGTIDGPCKVVGSLKSDTTGKWQCQNRGPGENDWIKVG